MAKRLYQPSTGAAPISPSVIPAWGVTTGPTRRAAVTTRINSAMTEFVGVGDAAVGTQVVLQFVYGPLAAQTISGTVKGQMRIRRDPTGAGDPGRLALGIQCVDSAGANPLVLLAPTYSTQTSTPPDVNGVDTATNRSYEEGNADYALALTSQNCPEGGYVVMEIGYRDETTNTARYIRLTAGDNDATDLPEDRTTTAANNPWIEFTSDLTEASVDPEITDVDGDNIVTLEQQNITVTGTNFNTATFEIRQGAFDYPCNVDSQNATTLVFDMPDVDADPAPKYGAATAALINASTAEDTQAITIVVASGSAYVDIGTPDPDAIDRITATPDDIVTGDQLWYYGVIGGTIADVTIYSDATFRVAVGVTAFKVRQWRAATSEWSAEGTQLIGGGQFARGYVV